MALRAVRLSALVVVVSGFASLYAQASSAVYWGVQRARGHFHGDTGNSHMAVRLNSFASGCPEVVYGDQVFRAGEEKKRETYYDCIESIETKGDYYKLDGNLIIYGIDLASLGKRFKKLTSVDGKLDVQYTKLENLDSLERLTHVGAKVDNMAAQLDIRGNTQLTNLRGLKSLAKIGGLTRS